MPHLSPVELLIIFGIVVAIFGAGKLASLGGALGKGVKDFRTAVKDNNDKAAAEAKADETVKPVSVQPAADVEKSENQGNE